jgi:hypothetical protein
MSLHPPFATCRKRSLTAASRSFLLGNRMSGSIRLAVTLLLGLGMLSDCAVAQAKPLMAAAMHPMWLIIKEDTVCCERTPPWGAATIDDYAQRLSRNVASLELNSTARLNYDFSAAELEDVKAMYPDIANRIRAAVGRGQIGIINGTYSQPHLQTLSLEASVHQIAAGTQSIRDNYGYNVRTYAMQEPGYTDQTVQILKAFGYQYGNICLSGFPHAQQVLPGQTYTGGEAFLTCRSLDGSGLLAMQPAAGISTSIPDMQEFTPNSYYEYATLDNAQDRVLAAYQGAKPSIRAYVP